MFNAGCFIELNSKRVARGSLLCPFLFNVYMHDFDQFVENLSDDCFKMITWCKNKNYHDLIVKKYKRRYKCKFPNQMLKYNKRYCKI